MHPAHFQTYWCGEMATGILLIHGFTGAPDDFGTLPAALAACFGPDAVRTVRLPGHASTEPPRFDGEALIAAVDAAASEFLGRGDDLVVIGHSTGGTLALAALADRLASLRLLVLVAVPKRIDSAYLQRWRDHARPGNAISFTSLASLVHLVNRVDARSACPVLLLQGEQDELVPCSEVFLWEGALSGPVRTVLVPEASHHIFTGARAGFVQDLLQRAISDACYRPDQAAAEAVRQFTAVEPEAAGFLALSPQSVRHLAASPAVLSLVDRTPALSENACSEPLFLNMEITTRCNLRCPFCARTSRPSKERDMPVETFRRILDLLPHGYRVTLVGLGEPLLHPQVDLLVREAVKRGRRVSLVTSAMQLDAEMGRRLLDAGLSAITFSLDAATQETADQVRPGSDMERILSNIEAFCRLSDSVRRVPRAVFSAISLRTLPHLEELVTAAARLGVDAMMLSDLNFAVNAPHSLSRSGGDALLAARQAVRTAFSLGLPLLSVHGLEELGLSQRYHRHLLTNPSRLVERSAARANCFSPWQTLAVSVDGSVTVCDCQPDRTAGNLLSDPFGEIWQGSVMKGQRREMLGSTPPPSCSICPRF